jgi:CheY-like chemotaxis protein
MHILLIDDSSSTRSLLRTLINSGQAVRHEISEAASGEEALQKVESGEISLPQIIIMDINMGGMSGFNLCREFRKRHGTSDVVPYIIIVTANEGVEVINKVLDVGANDYMPKPVNVKILQVRLRVAERILSHPTVVASQAAVEENGASHAELSPEQALILWGVEQTDAPIAIVEATAESPSFRIVYSNQALTLTTQYPAEELVGKPLAELEAWTTEFIDMVTDFVGRGALLSHVPLWSRTRQDFQVYLSFYPIRTEDTPLTHYLVIHHL